MIEALPVLVLVAATAWAYGAGVRLVWRRRGRSVFPVRQVASFFVGLLVVVAALTGPIDTMSDERFSAHMVEHLMLLMVAAPLLSIGAPVSLLLLTLPRNARRRVMVPVLRSRVAHVIFAPRFAFCTVVGALWVSHYPPIYDAAVTNQGLHDLEHMVYVTTAFLLWSVVFGLDAGPTRMTYPGRLLMLFGLMASTSVLGLVLTSTTQAVYPYYVRAAARTGISAVDDQHLGGVIMWVGGMVVVVCAMGLVLLPWLADEEHRTKRRELRERRDSLPPQRLTG